MNNNQPGDVGKAARVIVDVMTQSGASLGKEISMRLVLGSGAMQGIRDEMRKTEALLKEWEDVIVSTDNADAKQQV